MKFAFQVITSCPQYFLYFYPLLDFVALPVIKRWNDLFFWIIKSFLLLGPVWTESWLVWAEGWEVLQLSNRGRQTFTLRPQRRRADPRSGRSRCPSKSAKTSFTGENPKPPFNKLSEMPRMDNFSPFYWSSAFQFLRGFCWKGGNLICLKVRIYTHKTLYLTPPPRSSHLLVFLDFIDVHLKLSGFYRTTWFSYYFILMIISLFLQTEGKIWWDFDDNIGIRQI